MRKETLGYKEIFYNEISDQRIFLVFFGKTRIEYQIIKTVHKALGDYLCHSNKFLNGANAVRNTENIQGDAGSGRHSK